jgi:uncharacterized protein
MSKTVNDIQPISFAAGAFTTLDYGMDESELRLGSAACRRYSLALWQGKVGAVDFPATETTEVCWLTEGKIALTDEFSAGEGYVLPKGFAGRWETLVDAKKMALILED